LENAVSFIHPTALISSRAELAQDVSIGPYVVIEDNVAIGSGCEIGAHATLKRFTRLGTNNHIREHAVLGGLPQDVKFKHEQSELIIGNNNLIGEFTTLHRACGEGKQTRIGSHNFLMVGVHIAHNCVVGDMNVMANGTALAGHVEVEDGAFFSSNVGCHQFARIGRLAMIGGKSKITQDVLPFCTTDGNPPLLRGLNSIGLRRAGVDSVARAQLKLAFKVLFRSGIPFADARARVAEFDNECVVHLLHFIEDSKRGCHRKTLRTPAQSQAEQEGL
jgi:UDP-N-acetylglucosamine acyltransferase